MKTYLIKMHLQVPRSRSSAKVNVKYKGYISQEMAISGAFVFHKHILFGISSIIWATFSMFLQLPSTWKGIIFCCIVKRQDVVIINICDLSHEKGPYWNS